MKKIISILCLLLLAFPLTAQSYRNTTTRGRSTTQQRSGQGSRNSMETVSGLLQSLQNSVDNTKGNTRKTTSTKKQKKTETQSSSAAGKNVAGKGSTKEQTTAKVQPNSEKLAGDEIALVVSGEGLTKNEATASALRSAIEQAFGTFVSANTTLLNDDIVRDEIATVASGNIKSYREISSVRNADGRYNVSISAVVSIGKLISYAQSHGSSTEFAGQTFMMNMRMRELNKKNEYEALQNMLAQLRSLQDDIFDYEVKALDPKQDREGNWEVPVKLFIKTNQNYCSFFEILDNTLSSLSLSEEEQGAYTNNNMEYYAFSPYGIATGGDIIILEEGKDYVFLRNPMKDIASEIAQILTTAQKSCLIKTIGLKQERFPKIHDIQPYEISRYSGYMVTLYESSGKQVPDDEASSRVVIHQLLSRSTGLGLSRAANVIFAEPTIIFKFSLEELGRVQGFDVVKAPIPESNT